jgi:hypothetical protein
MQCVCVIYKQYPVLCTALLSLYICWNLCSKSVIIIEGKETVKGKRNFDEAVGLIPALIKTVTALFNTILIGQLLCFK